MAIPKWHEFMAPVLRVLTDGEVRRRRELYEMVELEVALDDEQRSELLSSGQRKHENRIGWATSYLNRVGALDRPARGQYVITDVGRTLLADHPGGVTEKHLRALAGDESAPHTWYALKMREQGAMDPAEQADLDPVEQIQEGVDRISSEVASELLSRLHGQEPTFFEQAVLNLLMRMGYGGADGAATRTQLSHDGGIDGIIDQDALGLSRVHVQAKRYGLDQVVQRPDVQGFVGALAGSQANQGVFITTGRFSAGARDYAASVPTRVVLIDGARLANLMIKYGVGVQVERTVEIVKVDEDFFE